MVGLVLFHWLLGFGCFCLFWDRVSLCSSDWPGIDSQRSACLCLPSRRINNPNYKSSGFCFCFKHGLSLICPGWPRFSRDPPVSPPCWDYRSQAPLTRCYVCGDLNSGPRDASTAWLAHLLIPSILFSKIRKQFFGFFLTAWKRSIKEAACVLSRHKQGLPQHQFVYC